MAERAVEDAPAAVFADPRKGEVAIGPMDSVGSQVYGAGIQRKEDAYPVAGKVAELIELLGGTKRRRQVSYDRALRIFDIDGRLWTQGCPSKMPPISSPYSGQV